MATLTPQQIAQAGTALTFAAATATTGDKFASGDHTTCLIKNGSGSGITATFTTTKTVNGLAVADETISVAAGATVEKGPFPNDLYGDANGLVTVVCSAVTTVTIAVRKLS